MRTVRKILKLIAISTYCALLSFQPLTVRGETESYARVLLNDVYIYQDAEFEEPMFSLPFGYYVKLEEKNEAYLKVSYGSGDYPTIYGYVKKGEVAIVDYIPSTPFTVIKVSTDLSDILFNDLKLVTPYFNVPKNEILYYYGEIKSGDKIMCFVYYAKKLGYIDKTSLNPFSITPNPDAILETDKNENLPIDNGEENPSKINPFGEHIQVVIIVGISIISISVVYFLFKPSKHKTEEEN